jgi:hypothetical protein
MRKREAMFCRCHPCVIPLYDFSRGEEGIITVKCPANDSFYDVLDRVKDGNDPTSWDVKGEICEIVLNVEFIHCA